LGAFDAEGVARRAVCSVERFKSNNKPGGPMPIVLLIHMIFAVALIGAITHQTISVLAPVKKSEPSFVGRYRATNPAAYVNAIIALFVIVNVLGWFIYPNYRIGARMEMSELRLFWQVGTFEVKENIMALGVATLPFYWWVWQPANAQLHPLVRKVVTCFIAVLVWYGFLVGHFLNNIRGIV
jgi:hypothetical protein